MYGIARARAGHFGIFDAASEFHLCDLGVNLALQKFRRIAAALTGTSLGHVTRQEWRFALARRILAAGETHQRDQSHAEQQQARRLGRWNPTTLHCHAGIFSREVDRVEI